MSLKIKLSKQDLNKLIITLVILFALRIGYVIPLPFINQTYLKELSSTLANSGFSFLNLVSGNSFEQMSIFALSITPYITASIVIQLLGVVIPSLGELQKGGKTDREKYERINYLAGAAMAIIQATAMSIGLGRQGLFTTSAWYWYVLSITIWSAGAIFLMWLGKRMTDKLIGNGISLILLFNILSSIIPSFSSVFTIATTNRSFAMGALIVLFILAIVFGTVLLTIYYNAGEERVKIISSRRLSMFGSGIVDNFLPIRVAICSVIPVIFASTLLSIPSIIGVFVQIDYGTFGGKVVDALSQNMWFNPQSPWYTLGALIYVALIFAFSYFYLAIAFNPIEIAENLKSQGITIPGVRSGKPTVELLRKKSFEAATVGAIMITVIVFIPIVISGLSNIKSLALGGTSIIIIISVILETAQTLRSNNKSYDLL